MAVLTPEAIETDGHESREIARSELSDTQRALFDACNKCFRLRSIVYGGDIPPQAACAADRGESVMARVACSSLLEANSIAC